jgi:hypothetical protein
MNSAIEKYSPIDMVFSFTLVCLLSARRWGNFLDVAVLLSYTLFYISAKNTTKKCLIHDLLKMLMLCGCIFIKWSFHVRVFDCSNHSDEH